MVNYSKNFKPYTYTGEDGSKTMWESSYIEVGTKCFHYPGLENDENTILLYSALLSLKNNPAITFTDMELEVCYYDIFKMADLLNMSIVTACQSINKLKDLNLISVVDNVRYSSFIGLVVNQDLRYTSNSEKDIIRVYCRIFFYPTITKQMAILYSYCLQLSKSFSFQRHKPICYRKATETLGYSKDKIISTLNEMEYIGLVARRFYSETVELKVDFSRKQPEERLFERDLYKEESRKTEKEKKRKPQFDPEIEAAFIASDRAALENYDKWLQTDSADGFDPFDVKVYPEDKNYFVELRWSNKGENLLYPEVTIKHSPTPVRYVW